VPKGENTFEFLIVVPLEEGISTLLLFIEVFYEIEAGEIGN